MAGGGWACEGARLRRVLGVISSAGLTLGFAALPNLDYTLQYRGDLSPNTNPWSLLQELGSSPVDRFLSVTSPIPAAPSRFYRLWAKP